MKVLVQITTDSDKLWQCPELRRKHPHLIGKLPRSSGRPIHIDTKTAKTTFWCPTMTWLVIEDELFKNSFLTSQGARVCEHQIDFAD